MFKSKAKNVDKIAFHSDVRIVTTTTRQAGAQDHQPNLTSPGIDLDRVGNLMDNISLLVAKIFNDFVINILNKIRDKKFGLSIKRKNWN